MRDFKMAAANDLNIDDDPTMDERPIYGGMAEESEDLDDDDIEDSDDDADIDDDDDDDEDLDIDD